MDKDKRLVNKNLVNVTKTIDITGYNEDIVLRHQNEVSRTIHTNNLLGVTYNTTHTKIFAIYSINCYLYDGEQPSSMIDIIGMPNGPLRNVNIIANNLTKNILLEGNSSVHTSIRIGGKTIAPSLQETAIEGHYLQRWSYCGGFVLTDLQAEPGDVIQFTLTCEGYQYIDGKYMRCSYPQQTQYAIVS